MYEMNRAIALALTLILLLAGCATPRSHSAKLDERTRVWFKSLEMEKVRKENESALIVAGEFGIKLAGKLVGYLVESEGKKYTENTGARTSVHIRKIEVPDAADTSKVLLPVAKIEKGGFFLFGRTVNTKEFGGDDRSESKQIKGLRRLNDKERDRLACEIFGTLHTYGGEDTADPSTLGCPSPAPIVRAERGGPPGLLDDIRKYIDSLRTDEKGKAAVGGNNSVVTMMALGAIRPVEERSRKQRKNGKAAEPSRGFELQLMGYEYTATKAKNLSFKFPWTSFHDTKSVLSVALQGPQAYPLASGKQFSATGSFRVKWDRKLAKDNRGPKWVELPKEAMKYRSGPIAVPATQDFLLTVSLVESSDLTKALKGAAKEISELEISLGDD